MSKPIVVQHSFGELGGGGPAGALHRLMASDLSQDYEFHPMRQPGPLGGVDTHLIREWRAFLCDLRPDIVHVRGLGNEGFHGAIAARSAGVPHVLVSVHGTHRDLVMPSRLADAAKSSSVRWGIEPTTLVLAHHLATVCEFAARRPFIARHSSKSVGVVPNGVDIPVQDPRIRKATRESLGIEESADVMIFVGRITAEKGLGDLVRALRFLRSPGTTFAEPLHLIVVGDGPDRQHLEGAFGTIPELWVRFLGKRLDVQALLAAADLFVFPSLHENLSNALLEAMAAGLAPIACDVGGNTEVLQGGAGVLVPRGAPEQLGLAIGRLLADPGERATIGQHALARVEAKYTTSQMIAGWGDVYSRLLSGER